MQNSTDMVDMQSVPRSGAHAHIPTNTIFNNPQQPPSWPQMSNDLSSTPQLSSAQNTLTNAQIKLQNHPSKASRRTASSTPSFALEFDHFRPPQPASSRNLINSFPETKLSCTRTPSSAVKDTSTAQNEKEYFGAFRFQDHKNRGSGSARTKPHNITLPDQKFVDINSKNGFQFLLSTPETHAAKRSLENVDASTEDSTSQDEDGEKKRLRLESSEDPSQCKDSSMRSTRIELRTNKPLQNAEDVNPDVWRIILKNSPLKFLLSAKTLNRHFYRLLKEESTIWYESRVNQYSKDMPGPPGQMSEQQYAQLLEGKGCQNISCPQRSTGKVYWAFCVRLCELCYHQKTVKEEYAKRYQLEDPITHFLLSLLPAAVVDGGKYSRCRLINTHSGDWEATTAGAVYSKAEVDKIQVEFRQLEEVGRTADEIADWKAQKKEAAIALTSHLADIENWDRDRADSAPKYRVARADFFKQQAAMLPRSEGGPMSEDVLKKMLAFKMSLDANTEPSKKTWDILKAKIVPYRAEAEQLVSYEQQMLSNSRPGLEINDIDAFNRLRNTRLNKTEPPGDEQNVMNLVRQLAQEQLEHWKTHGANDADLVLRVLRGVFETYHRRLYQKANGEHYELTLDDARIVIEKVIEPEVKSWNNPRRTTAALQSFKCAGCPRKDCKTRYSFVKGFEHIHGTHAKYVGEGTKFAMFAKPFPRYSGHDTFPWYTTPWPRNLPLVASHHEVNRQAKWFPDANIPYVSAREPSTVSAFANRAVYNILSVLASDFDGNLVFAARELQPTVLSSESQTRIALQYALDRYATVHGTQKPVLGDFTACFKNIQDANRKFDFRYRCGYCARQTSVPRTTKFIKSPVHFHELEEHFEKKHAGYDWTIDLMDLPSGEQLLDLILDGDNELKEKQELVRAREAAAKISLRKKPCPKAKVVLSTPTSMEVFDRLYLKT